MKLEVEISKARFFVILGTLLILTGILGVIAFGGSSPSVVGHNADEIGEGTIGNVLKILNGQVGISGLGYIAPLTALTVSGDSANGVGIDTRGFVGIKSKATGTGPNTRAAVFNGFVQILGNTGGLTADSGITSKQNVCFNDGTNPVCLKELGKHGWVSYSSGSIFTTCQDSGYKHPTGMCKDFSGTIGAVVGSETKPNCLTSSYLGGTGPVAELYCT